MTTNRLLTTAVQLALAIPALIMGRMMWEMLKEDVRELTKDLR
jgi:dihydrofolate reductase